MSSNESDSESSESNDEMSNCDIQALMTQIVTLIG